MKTMPSPQPWKVEVLSGQLREGTASSTGLVGAALDRAHDPAGQGSVAFTRIYDEQARLASAASDLRLREGRARSLLEGLPISVKDLCDVEGEPTRSGSIALSHAAPAQRDATVVERLRAAGAVLIGKTNMTEFAFSGLGLNPHFGNPLTPWQRDESRVAGGSSSGAAVSVSDAMAVAGIGSDTGGSIRTPAAFCGLTGFKPTARRVPRDGCFELSASLDSLGPIANSVACCALIDAILAGEDLKLAPLSGPPTLAIPGSYLLDGCDPEVMAAYDRALAILEGAGAKLVILPADAFSLAGELVATGSFATIEGWRRHSKMLIEIAERVDPMVFNRFALGAEQTSRLDDLRALRADLTRTAEAVMQQADAIILPTVPILPPRVSEVADAQGFGHFNGLALRNTAVANFIDGCALTVPCQAPGEPPVGLSIMATGGFDHRVLAIGRFVEHALWAGIDAGPA